MTHPILVGVNDLFFSAKIDAAAKQLGIPLKCLPTCGHLLTACREAAPPLVLLDLESVGGDPSGFLKTLREDEGLRDIEVIAFGRHTNADALARLREAGADRAMPRSEFVVRLPELLQSHRRSSA